MQGISVKVELDANQQPTITVDGKVVYPTSGPGPDGGGQEYPQRYLVTHRRAHVRDDAGHLRAKASLDGHLKQMAPNVKVVHDTGPRAPTQRRIVRVDATPSAMARHVASAPPDVIIEPEIFHYPQAFTVTVNDSTGNALPNINGTLVLADGTTSTARSDNTGLLTFQASTFDTPKQLRLNPSAGFWPQVLDNPVSAATVVLPTLTPSDANALGWWHELLWINQFDLTLGTNISVGVIDTGTGPHNYLAHATSLGAYVSGVHTATAAAGQDVQSHGTHVAGLIGARPPQQAGPYVGVSPGVTLYTARVFAQGAAGASNGDIAMALDDMSTNHDVHLINLSLGSPVPSMIVYDALLSAERRGTLAVCAAGNAGQGLGFPAAFEETMAITALGNNTAQALPANTPSARTKPAASASGRFGRGFFDTVFFPLFSNFGRGVSFIAPGVGIISTVPARNGLVNPYAAMDGTSMASPIACATMAILLAQDNAYSGMAPDEARTRRARQILSNRALSTQLGLKANFEGHGLLSSVGF